MNGLGPDALQVIKPKERPEPILVGDVAITIMDENHEHVILIWSNNTATHEESKTQGQMAIGHPESTEVATKQKGVVPRFKPHELMHFVGRVHQNPKDNEYCVMELAKETQDTTMELDSAFKVFEELPKITRTSCSGFVCTAFRLRRNGRNGNSVLLIEEDFGAEKKFECPSDPTNKDRTHPAPGHLARVFVDRRAPWAPADSAEAERWKRTQSTIDDLT